MEDESSCSFDLPHRMKDSIIVGVFDGHLGACGHGVCVVHWDALAGPLSFRQDKSLNACLAGLALLIRVSRLSNRPAVTRVRRAQCIEDC